jgi:hypothetical protein
MKKLLFILIMFFGKTVDAQNPYQPKKETIDALQKISFLTGNWKGTGWI